MKVRNRHARKISKPPERVGDLLDTLATKEDALWPHEQWPPMAFDGPLAVGANGGHGPIRYTVEAYDPGRSVLFRFTSPRGFLGTHGFSIRRAGEESPGLGGESELAHSIDMEIRGAAILSWPLVFRPLHDALLEDSLDKAEARLAGQEWEKREWSSYVQVLRRLLARRRIRRKRR